MLMDRHAEASAAAMAAADSAAWLLRRSRSAVAVTVAAVPSGATVRAQCCRCRSLPVEDAHSYRCRASQLSCVCERRCVGEQHTAHSDDPTDSD